jgi:putative Holliday junction resolvase
VTAAPAPRRVLAVDFGDTRTGLAATDWTGAICVPLGRLTGLADRELALAIAAIVRERATELVVLGMPLLLDQQQGPRARRTEQFMAVLAAAIAPCPVETIDESHSTDEAHELLKQGGVKAARRKQLADSIAALVILERWRALHRQRPRS